MQSVVISLNVRSLTKRLDEIKILVEDKRHLTFLSLCETQLDDYVSDEELHLDGYLWWPIVIIVNL